MALVGPHLAPDDLIHAQQSAQKGQGHLHPPAYAEAQQKYAPEEQSGRPGQGKPPLNDCSPVGYRYQHPLKRVAEGDFPPHTNSSEQGGPGEKFPAPYSRIGIGSNTASAAFYLFRVAQRELLFPPIQFDLALPGLGLALCGPPRGQTGIFLLHPPGEFPPNRIQHIGTVKLILTNHASHPLASSISLRNRWFRQDFVTGRCLSTECSAFCGGPFSFTSSGGINPPCGNAFGI